MTTTSLMARADSTARHPAAAAATRDAAADRVTPADTSAVRGMTTGTAAAPSGRAARSVPVVRSGPVAPSVRAARSAHPTTDAVVAVGRSNDDDEETSDTELSC